MAAPAACRGCHGIFDPQGSPYDTWAGSPMGHAARNPLFLSALTEAEKDAPGVGDLCLRCHAPAAWLEGRCFPTDGSGLLPDDPGVTCAACHRMDPSPYQQNGQYFVGEDLEYRGQRDDAMPPHRYQPSTWISDSKMCGTCHDLRNPLVMRRDLDGTLTTQAFPEQTTYSEWAASAFAAEGERCQDCHMPTDVGRAAEAAPIRQDRASHAFAGGNVFLLAAIAFLEPGLGLSDQLIRGQARMEAALRTAADLELIDPPQTVDRGERVELSFRITNLTGHKLPTGYPEGRRVWLSVDSAPLGLELGRFEEATGEPEAPAALYHAVQGQSGIGPGHRLALNDTIYFDNRIPPRGFVPTATIAPVGADFEEVEPGVLAHWDDVTVTATVPCDLPDGPIELRASLWYQSVTKAYVDALVKENGNDPRAFRLQAAFEEADPGPTEMLALTANLMLRSDSSCAPPDMGVDAGVDLGTPDAGPPDSGVSDQGMPDAGEAPEDDGGCGCSAQIRKGRSSVDGASLIGLLLIFVALFMRKSKINLRSFDRVHHGSRRLRAALAVLALGGLSCGETAPDLLITTGALADVRLGENYDQKIEVTGGTAPYQFSVASGALPEGLALGAQTGQITGTAMVPGRAMFTIKADDAEGATASQALQIYVVPESLQIVTTMLPGGKEGEAYDQTLVGRGGVPALQWSVEQGSLPNGISLSTEGQLSGTPTDSGDFTFTVKLADQEGAERQQELSLTLLSANPEVQTMTLPAGRVGAPYEESLQADGGVPPYEWTVVEGALPGGVMLATDGTLAGTPDSEGNFVFTVQVTDSQSGQASLALTLDVVAPLAIETLVLPALVIDRPMAFSLQASGGVPPYDWSLGGGALPAGITLSAAGALEGSTGDTGEYPVTVRVRDAEGFQKSALFTLNVSDRFVFTIEPAQSFPSTCTSTTVSYQSVFIDVPQSMQIEDLDVSIDASYVDENTGAPASNRRLKVELIGPTGRNAMLCGNGSNIPGGIDCDGSGGIGVTFDDSGAVGIQPNRPLSVFNGTNPQGRWELRIGVVSAIEWTFGNRIPQNMCPQNPRVSCRSGPAPTPGNVACGNVGTINAVSLSVRDDRSTDDYVMVQGWFQNNLVPHPFIRLGGGGLEHQRLYLRATAYGVGPNGFPEAGQGDDMVLPDQLIWSWQSAPIEHVELTPDGRITAGEADANGNGVPDQDTGSGMLTASGGGHSVSVPIYVTPPSWNTQKRQF